MIVVATYDISSDGRRSKVAAILQSWGDRVQRSVYVLNVTADTLKVIRDRCSAIMDLDVDSLYFLPMCPTCWAATTFVGQAQPPGRVLFWAAL